MKKFGMTRRAAMLAAAWDTNPVQAIVRADQLELRDLVRVAIVRDMAFVGRLAEAIREELAAYEEALAARDGFGGER